MMQKNKKNFNYSSMHFFNGKLKGMLCTIIVLLFLESFMNLKNKSLYTAISCALGYIQVSNYNMFLRSILRFLLPQIAAVIVWGNYFDEALLGNAAMVFTRTRHSKKVLFYYMKNVLLGVSVMIAFLILGLFFIYGLKGYHINSFTKILSDCVLYLVYINVFILSINIISLFMNVMYSILVIFVLQIVYLQGIYMIEKDLLTNNIYHVIPTSSVMMLLNVKIGMDVRAGWLVYLLGILVLLYWAGCFILKRKEFLS